MAFLPKVLVLLMLAVVCVQLNGVLAEIPVRCQCVDELKKAVRKETIEEFAIFPKNPKCNKVEIILTLKSNNTNKDKRCLNPHTIQGQNLQSCWKSKNINNTTTFKMSDCPMSQNPKA
ncbi:chemokine (C-X-C motif) ligand 18b [Pseudorasbora parva]|uniref:chemokine (C-X-C motif) ligand 18b n=1 Tax=Pseudorasbora parva TaxID=51549 RepID=UPI00351DF1D2